MIDVRELRLGNYIYFDGAIHEILGVQKLSIWTKWHNDADGKPKYFEDLESYNPIPITPALLEICGFIEDAIINSDGDEREFMKHGTVMDLRYINEEINYDCSDFEHIKYLHQLQNIFFHVIGTELQIDFNSYGVNKTI